MHRAHRSTRTCHLDEVVCAPVTESNTTFPPGSRRRGRPWRAFHRLRQGLLHGRRVPAAGAPGPRHQPRGIRRLLGGEQRHLHGEQHHGAGNHPVGFQVHRRGRRPRRRRPARRPQDAGRAGLLVAGVFVLAAPIIARFVKAPEHVSLFRLAAAIPLVYAFYAVYVGTANGLRKFHLQAGFDVGFSTAKTILLLAGAVVGRMLGHSVAGAFVGFIAAALIILLVAGRTIGMRAGQQTFPAPRLVTFMGGVVAVHVAHQSGAQLRSAPAPAFRRRGRARSPADALAGAYEAVRNLALLPYQALLVVTFVIFPLVSRATFAADREATAAYVRQTLRYALILGVALAVTLSARPAALLAILYPKAYGVGAQALPILAAGIVALALLSIAGSIVTASGRPDIAVGLVALTLAVGSALAFAIVPGTTPGAAMLTAAALATALGMLAGLLAALVYLWRRFAALPPLLSVLRVCAAAGLATGLAA
jgi:O-antigen/teichoic acid export membrane protein